MYVMYDRGAWFLSSRFVLLAVSEEAKKITSTFASLTEQDIEKVFEDKDSQNTKKSTKVA